MYILPKPIKLIEKDNYFILTNDTLISLNNLCNFDDLETAIVLQEKTQNILGYKLAITKQFNVAEKTISFNYSKEIDNKEGYKLNICPNNICITASTSTGLFYGVQTLIQIIMQKGASIPCIEIEDKPHFEYRGFYHDITRSKVPTLETLKNLVDKASFYKLNSIQLYIEHTFAFTNMSETWFNKSPITAEEILILDKYAKSRYVELVPSLSTFGHLYEVLRTNSYKHLCELDGLENEPYGFVDRQMHHTLNPLDEGSYKLVKHMLNEFIPLFSSDKFNICCDETFDLGKGKSKSEADKIGVGSVYVNFLTRIIDIVKGHNKSVMFWSDVILHHPELLPNIPKDLTFLTWQYHAQCDDKPIATIAKHNEPQYVCAKIFSGKTLMQLQANLSIFLVFTVVINLLTL